AENTSVSAMKMAVKNRGVRKGLIFHSDRGVRYACDEFKSILRDNDIIQSMSRKANCWDNAVAESFFKSLKAEMVYHRRFIDQQSAKLEVFGYIEGFYNTRRIYSALGYKTPKQMEEMLLKKAKLAAYKSHSFLVAVPCPICPLKTKTQKDKINFSNLSFWKPVRISLLKYHK